MGATDATVEPTRRDLLIVFCPTRPGVVSRRADSPDGMTAFEQSR
jgi:hypothetical protein